MELVQCFEKLDMAVIFVAIVDLDSSYMVPEASVVWLKQILHSSN